MRRITVTLAALAAAAALASTASGAPRADTPLGSTPAAKLLACDATGADRSATFVGRMDAIPGASRMAMRFTLLERLGREADWQKVDLASLRAWHRSAPGVKTYAYKQTVDNLHAGGAYKARVQYRWLTAGGLTVDTVTRETPVCRGPLPNLAVAALEVQPGPTPDTRTYRVTVENTGRGDADSVDVQLSVDRAVLDTATIDLLDSGDTRTVSFTGPLCAHAVRVRVDPSNTVGETQEDDNFAQYGCQG
jgi:CARDB protein